MRRILAVLLAVSVVLVGCDTNGGRPPESTEEPATQAEEYTLQIGELGDDTGPSITIEEIIEVLAQPRPINDPERGEEIGYGNNRIAQLMQWSRQSFEGTFLPNLLLEHRHEIARHIENLDIEEIESLVHQWWAEEVALTLLVKLTDLREQFEGSSREELAEELLENLDTVLKALDMSAEEYFLDMKIVQLNEGVDALIITLYDPGWRLISSYIGLVDLGGLMGFRYFTLERSLGRVEGEAPYRLRYVADIFHVVPPSIHWGTSPMHENTREAFLEAIRLDAEQMLLYIEEALLEMSWWLTPALLEEPDESLVEEVLDELAELFGLSPDELAALLGLDEWLAG